mgnify:CR=1 FL=1
MKVLMIEDNTDDIAGIIDYCIENGWEQENKSFEEGLDYIEKYNPDIIVLDLQDKADDCFPGSSILDKIWNKSFRPVCIFSGQLVNAAIIKENYTSPLVYFVNKGDENPVIEYLSKLEPYTNSIRKMQEKMHEAFRRSFDVLQYVFQDEIRDENIIAYLCNCRMKDSFSYELQDSTLPAWGQYIYPSLSEHMLTGDVICSEDDLNSKNQKDRTYYVIISQSCDIITQKISRILAAKCQDKQILNEALSLPHKIQNARDRLSKYLNAGYEKNLFFLPSFGEILPDLVVDLKDIITIEFDALIKYKKIISLSSPYCERLVWAFMQNACRPGVPSFHSRFIQLLNV